MLTRLWNYVSYIGIEDKEQVINVLEDKIKILFNRAMLVGSIALVFYYGTLFPFIGYKAILYCFISEASILLGYYFLKRKKFYTATRIVVYTVYSLGILTVLETGNDILGHLAGLVLSAFAIMLLRKHKIDVFIVLLFTATLIFAGEWEPLHPKNFSSHPFTPYARILSLLNLAGMAILFGWVLADLNEFYETRLLKVLTQKNILLRDIQEINLQLKKANSLLQLKSEEIETQTEELQSSNEELYRLNLQLKKQSEKMEKVNRILSERNQQVLSSLLYARNLQEMLLPSEEDLKTLGEHFVLYKPKDILSGDFYWIHKFSGTEYLFAVGDATGHGVPGAIVSFVCVHILFSAVLEHKLKRPDKILAHAQKELCKMFASDGMDIALCLRQGNTLYFSGARSPLWLVRNEQIRKFSPARHSIGACKQKTTKFELKEISLQKGDVLYLFSDGIIDQFGGKQNRKLGIKNFKEVLLKIHTQNPSEQKEMLETFLENWMGNNSQTDDICVMGIRIS